MVDIFTVLLTAAASMVAVVLAHGWLIPSIKESRERRKEKRVREGAHGAFMSRCAAEREVLNDGGMVEFTNTNLADEADAPSLITHDPLFGQSVVPSSGGFYHAG